jgi:hypothetical protein
VEQGANLVVRRDFVDAEQRPGIVVALRLLKTALVVQKRGALREAHRKGAQRRVDHRVGLVLALPRVDETLEGAAQPLRNVVQGEGKGTQRSAHRAGLLKSVRLG